MKSQVDLLADWILANVPGEPSQSEGAGECAIRIMQQQRATIQQLELEVTSYKKVITSNQKEFRKAKEIIQQLEANVEKLEKWKRIILGAGTDREAVIRMAAAEYTEVAVQCWREANAKLEARVKAAEIREKRIFTIAGRHMFAGDYDRFKQDLDTAPDSA